MRSKLNFGPAFCLCLVTTKAGALADADDPWLEINPIDNAPQRNNLLNPLAENAQPAAPVTEPVDPPLRTRPLPQWHTMPTR